LKEIAAKIEKVKPAFLSWSSMGTFPLRWCLYFDVVEGLAWSNDPESYAGGSIATGRATHAGQVEGDDPD
jgi:hypothetical protein